MMIDVLLQEKEVTDLCINAEETIVNVKNLYEELHILNTRLAKVNNLFKEIH